MRTLNGGPDRPLAWLLAALLGLFLASSVPAYADVAAGQQAFDKGDYARAMSEWQSAADKGDAEGQLGLGKLYEFGLGDLAQNYKRADFWYRRAADQNNAEAQYRLALIWAVGGDDFPPDLAEAYYRLGLLLNKRHEKEKADQALARYKSLRDAEYSERATMLKELQDAVR